jgi:HlyD family secretion protein
MPAHRLFPRSSKRAGALARAALTCVAALALAVGAAQAAPDLKKPVEDMHKAVETLLNRLRGRDMPEGVVKTNGRIEATEVDVAAKYPGRLASVSVNEGDEVTAGQVVAVIASPEIEAQLRGAQATLLRAKQAQAEAEALISQRKSDLDYAKTDFERGKTLIDKGFIAQQLLDQRRNRFEAAAAALIAANSQRDEAVSQIAAAQADVERLQSVIVDLTLVSPRSGRVQYRLARAGEVVAPAQRILTILDLNDIYMTIYLPAAQAGKLALGDEARVILDPVPEYVFPARISFVATEAQFTPKSVETAEEREKLMFRVKLQAEPDILTRFHRQVKTGVRGLGFVRLDGKSVWPAELAVKLPQ